MAYNKKAPTWYADSNNLHIKSFACGIAHMFACSAQHYAWLAYQHQMPSVKIDLLELRIGVIPPPTRRYLRDSLFDWQ